MCIRDRYNTSYNQIYVDGAYISPYYEYATGAKTGYTPQAGNCLAATAKKDGTELIAVILKGVSLEMYQDAHNPVSYTHLDVYKRQVYLLYIICP